MLVALRAKDFLSMLQFELLWMKEIIFLKSTFVLLTLLLRVLS